MENDPTQSNLQPVMEDFIFGGIEADERQLLADTRQLWRGIRHLHTLDPLDPEPGQPVLVTVFVAPDIHVDRVTLYMTADRSDPAGYRGVAMNGLAISLQRVAVRWEALIWGYVEIWQAQIPAQFEGALVQYRIEGWSTYREDSSIWSCEPNLDRTVERPTLYGYHIDYLSPPRWAHEAVIYQVFVDRFTGVENRWLSPAELNSFTGGTLQGIIQKLDYIANLGITVLWLSPIFRTPTYHGYDTSDYYTIEPHFGSNADLAELVAAAHARGLRVILDFVANHTSVEFTPFVVAKDNLQHSYSEWFDFDVQYTHGYRAFFDVASMPQVNTDHGAARRFLIDAACYWLKNYQIDGYRLDYAAGPSHAFWSEFRAACHQVKPDCWLFGEVTLAGDRLRTYQGRLDGCLDFALARNIRQLCADRQPTITIEQFANEIERSRRFFDRNHFTLPAFIDNHDMNRFAWVAGNDLRRLRLAAGLLLALGGPPIIYYGTEVGLTQPRAKGPYRE
ncbi:MAG: alpha-amylase family glycosyl hydrolase [Chloroflexi bacterium]|nr:alpha-amylase family glycosyl hydrolase [Chloroflexota bacterium]